MVQHGKAKFTRRILALAEQGLTVDLLDSAFRDYIDRSLSNAHSAQRQQEIESTDKTRRSALRDFEESPDPALQDIIQRGKTILAVAEKRRDGVLDHDEVLGYSGYKMNHGEPAEFSSLTDEQKPLALKAITAMFDYSFCPNAGSIAVALHELRGQVAKISTSEKSHKIYPQNTR